MNTVKLPSGFQYPPTGQSLKETPFISFWRRYKENRTFLKPEIVYGLISMAAAYPFDPNEEIDENPLIASIIQNSRWERGVVGRRLPRTMDDPGIMGFTLDGNPAAADTEWLAGLLLLVGADPLKKGALEVNAMDLAMVKNMPAFIDACLDRPGAPSAQQLACNQAQDKNVNPPENTTWWQHLCTLNNGAETLRLLSQRGANPQHAITEKSHPLEKASVEVVALYAEKDWLPTEPEVRERIQKAWQKRSKEGSLSLEDLNAMTVMVSGKDDAFTALAQATVEKLLTHPLKRHFYFINKTISKDILAKRITIENGPMRGIWSGLSAAAAGTIRTGQKAEWWGGHGVFEKNSDNEKWNQPAEWAQYPEGVPLFKNAVAFEWREGVPAEAIVALAVADSNDSSHIGKNNQHLLNLLGVQDVKKWMRSLLPGMVAYTEAIRVKGAIATDIFISRWKGVEAIAGHPGDWGDNGWQLAYRVVAALSERKTKNNHMAPFREWAKGLFLQQSFETDNAEECVAHALIGIEILLTMDDTTEVDKMKPWIDNIKQHPALNQSATKTVLAKAMGTLLETIPPKKKLPSSITSTLEHLLLSCALSEEKHAVARTRIRM